MVSAGTDSANDVSEEGIRGIPEPTAMLSCRGSNDGANSGEYDAYRGICRRECIQLAPGCTRAPHAPPALSVVSFFQYRGTAAAARVSRNFQETGLRLSFLRPCCGVCVQSESRSYAMRYRYRFVFNQCLRLIDLTIDLSLSVALVTGFGSTRPDAVSDSHPVPSHSIPSQIPSHTRVPSPRRHMGTSTPRHGFPSRQVLLGGLTSGAWVSDSPNLDGNRDIAAVKLSGSDGTEVWRYQAGPSTSSSLGGGGAGISYALGVAVDGDDNPMLVGSVFTPSNATTSSSAQGGGDWNFFAIKLQGSTGEELWQIQGGSAFTRKGLRDVKVGRWSISASA